LTNMLQLTLGKKEVGYFSADPERTFAGFELVRRACRSFVQSGLALTA
jgi:hypothetical protein